MKKLLILLVFTMFSSTLFSQEGFHTDIIGTLSVDTATISDWQLNMDSVECIPCFNYHPTTINFTGDSTYFYLDMTGDSLVWGGDMKLTESAKRFIDFCDQYTYSKIDSLEKIILNFDSLFLKADSAFNKIYKVELIKNLK